MNTIIAKAGVDDDRMYEQAAEILKRGGLVASDICGKGPAIGQSAHSPYSRDIKRV